VHFYTQLLGMNIEWQPDADNVYLTSGSDNLALHRAPADFNPSPQQRLDHLGFIIKTPEEVDVWYDYLNKQQVKLHSQVKTHRDGARSFYCADPDDNVIQIIYHPPISDQS
jgi:catechol-2,3-dioxygenase